MNEPFFSIIIPVFNSEKYIKKCIESALGQEFEGGFEVVTINDGSSDGSLKILREFEGKIKILNTRNSGVSKARNLGLSKSRGKYILFLDSDDYLKKDALQNIYNTLTRAGGGMEFDLLFSPFFGVWEGGKGAKLYRPKCTQNGALNLQNTRGALLQAGFELCTKVYRREFLEESEISFQGFKLAEDLPFFYRCITRLKSAVYCEKPFYYYRKGHKKSLQNLGAISEVISAIQAADREIKLYPSFDEIREIYSKNALLVILYWYKNFKKLPNKKEFWGFAKGFLSEYGLDFQFKIKAFLINLQI